MIELRPAFARHETFHPRYGWLTKGYRRAADPAIFRADDATTRLGVGKNMVRAIRYWCIATKVLEERPDPDHPRQLNVHRTAFGDRLLGDDGWDPFLEDPASLWLLHWKLLAPPCVAPGWWSVFNTPRLIEFNDGTLLGELRAMCDTNGWTSIVDNSLIKDVRCLLRMYTSATKGRDLPEDSIDSPFAELDLIRSIPGSVGDYAMPLGERPQLPDAIVAFAVLDYLRASDSAARTVTIAGLAHTAGSPGRAFAMTETALSDALARFGQSHPDLLTITHAAGVRQVRMTEGVEPEALLEAHYGSRR